MAILDSDIKLMKSAVMTDTSDGGGAMTGQPLVDGLSNDLFPDTSEADRALGRVQARKLFGVAHTDGTETLLGAHAIITDAPDDPLVHVTLMKASGWTDTRAVAQDRIERYLVKGPRMSARLYDQHYAGAMSLRLIAFVSGVAFPSEGECIVLRTPAGVEQYVRVLKVTRATEQVAVNEGSSVVVLPATVATCQLGAELAHDFAGPPPQRVVEESNYAQVYATTVATGAKFYGVRPLEDAGAVGNLSLKVSGVYTPLVPAATVESPITDRYPLQGRGAVLATARAAVTLPGAVVSLGPGTVLQLPTAAAPQSIGFTHGAGTFTTDNAGNLRQGGVIVGTVDLAAGRVTMDSNAPAYGTASLALGYRPASAGAAAAHSAALTITQANAGLSFVDVFEPPPAPGSLVLSYMAQGRWYDLSDNGYGKLSGADSGYGVGTLNYTTGSMGVTLGALPDVGSALVALWGDSYGAKALEGELPARLKTALTLPARAQASGITLTWSRDGTNYTASTNAAGQLSGDATGVVEGGKLSFAPGVFPSGDVGIACTQGPSQATNASGGNGSYVLTAGLPIVPGTFRASVLAFFDAYAEYAPPALPVWDGNGVVYASYQGDIYAVGTIDYNTGAVEIVSPITVHMAYREVQTVATGWGAGTAYSGTYYGNRTVGIGGLTGIVYAWGAGASAYSGTITPGPWTAQLPAAGANLVTSHLCFTCGGEIYTAQAGTLRRGWSLGSAAPAQAAAGVVSSDGLVSVSGLPANGANGLVWVNVAVDRSGRKVSAGVFRTESAPLKTGVFQLQSGAQVGSSNNDGLLTGGGFAGSVDAQRGIVRWQRAGADLDAATLSYNAVLLQYLPLDPGLLGLDTARLPLDGRVPIYRAGELVVVHHTQGLQLPNPLTKGTVYDVGRVRVAAMKVVAADGATVPSTLYTTDLDAGTLVFPAEADLTGLAQPFTVRHRIEDMLLCSQADISGRLTFTRALTHDFPAGSSFVSSALMVGDLFARVHNHIEQATWSGAWSDAPIGGAPTANFNEGNYPITVTNRGAVTERWAVIFTNSTAFRVVGESVGEIATGTTGADCAPMNPATGSPYFTIPALGWGSGWGAGNVHRFNTDACGTALWVVRTVLQGPASVPDDSFTLAFRGDVDRP